MGKVLTPWFLSAPAAPEEAFFGHFVVVIEFLGDDIFVKSVLLVFRIPEKGDLFIVLQSIGLSCVKGVDLGEEVETRNVEASLQLGHIRIDTSLHDLDGRREQTSQKRKISNIEQRNFGP